jgi:hypothetical protein
MLPLPGNVRNRRIDLVHSNGECPVSSCHENPGTPHISCIHRDEPCLISRIAWAIAFVAGRLSRMWTWSSVPPTARAFVSCSRAIPPNICPQTLPNVVRDEIAALFGRKDAMKQQRAIGVGHVRQHPKLDASHAPNRWRSGNRRRFFAPALWDGGDGIALLPGIPSRAILASSLRDERPACLCRSHDRRITAVHAASSHGFRAGDKHHCGQP